METTNYAQILSERILALRREKGLTQEALAGQLGVSYQAVSKWENAQSCPDIALLPLLADIFGVPVDSLFGRQYKSEAPAPVAEPVFSYCDKLPWPDDRELRGVVALGHKILSHERPLNKLFALDVKKSEYTWLLRYSPLNVTAHCALHVEGDVKGGANVGSHMTCNDIGGGVNVGSHLSCNDIGGGVTAGSHVSCNDIPNGGVIAGSHIHCGDIGGGAKAGSSIECQTIHGDARATKITIKGDK